MTDAYTASRAYRLERTLQDLLAQTPELEAAAVVSFDGLPMASALPPSMDEDRVAAMCAALLSLGDRAAQGLGRGELSQVFIEGESGTVFLVSAQDEAVLVAVAVKGAKAGMMLYEVRRAAAQVAEVLQADAPAEPEPETAPETTPLAAVPDLPPLPEPHVVPEPPVVPELAAVPAQAPPYDPAPAVPASPVAVPAPHVTVVPTAMPWTSSYAGDGPLGSGMPSVMPTPPTAPAWT